MFRDTKTSNGVKWSLAVNTRFPKIDVSLNADCSAVLCYSDWTYAKWKMYLQRWNGAYWEAIDTRTGYVEMTSPSNRTFSNIMEKGKMRVYITIYPTAYHDYQYLDVIIR